jgi:predicted nucleic acid-binding protein
MQAAGLIDTGALLALLDRDDAWHERCRTAFQELRYPLATTSAVLAELFHLLGPNPATVASAWRLIRSGAITVLPMSDEDTPHLERLMHQYADRPLDLADATLVRLAERESLATVFTIDRDDFETYRIRGKTRFRIVP